ncbi:MAG TPA: radical SAM protein [Kofleriaceae bacterium]|nr:radical SAM protein [Kofleriaceae bacterium]
MKIEGRRYRDEWIPNYFPSRAVGGHRIRVSRTGKLIAMTPEEDEQLEKIFMAQELYERLERTGHIVTARNSADVLADLKTWFSLTYAGPMLHIVVATKRCNLDCVYCHMLPEAVGADPSRFDLQPDTAEAIVRFIAGTPNECNMIEFQGGEPFLNFEGIRHTVETAKRVNAEVGKRLDFTIVSNLMVAKDEQLAYCAENDIHISYSLNGPPDIHDRYRLTRSGVGSFHKVVRRIAEIQARFPGLISTSPLCVIAQESPEEVVRTIDFFHEAGFDSVALLKLRHLGKVRTAGLKYEFRDFMRSYIAGLDHILEKNRRGGRVYAERMVRVVLAKLLSDSDVGYVDWRNPIGDVSCVLTYDHDGEILPSDEARSLREEFTLGNVRDTTWQDLMERESTFRTMNLSLRDRDPTCRECPYNPYCGVAPILDFARTGDASPRPHESEECLFTIGLLDWAIARYLEDPVALLKMLPDADTFLSSLLAEAQSLAAGGPAGADRGAA